MTKVKTLILIALGLAAVTLTGCNHRDDDYDAPASYDQVGEARVYDEHPAPKRVYIQHAAPARVEPQVAKRSFHYDQVGETDIAE
jgi:hypothetical protein